jgi:hypothetical protein
MILNWGEFIEYISKLIFTCAIDNFNGVIICEISTCTRILSNIHKDRHPS